MKGKTILKLALSMVTAVMICPMVSLANAESSLVPDEWEGGIVIGLDVNGTYYTKASLIDSALGIKRY